MVTVSLEQQGVNDTLKPPNTELAFAASGYGYDNLSARLFLDHLRR